MTYVVDDIWGDGWGGSNPPPAAAYDGPYLQSADPAQNSLNILPDQAFTITLRAEAGFDAATLKVAVRGVVLFDGGTFFGGAAGTYSLNDAGREAILSFTTHPDFVQRQPDIIITALDLSAKVLQTSLHYYVVLSDVTDVQARTWCGGKRVDLSWTNPAGISRMRIRRSLNAFCRFTDDPGEDIYDGVPIEGFVDGEYVGALATSNEALLENRFYYYSIFISYLGAPYYWIHTSDVTGLSIKDYFAAEGDYVYRLLPRTYRSRDADPARGTDQYKLRDLCRAVIQCQVNLWRGWGEGLAQIKDPDIMPAGRIGEAFNQTGTLEAQAWELGLPPERSFDAGVLRRAVLGIVSVLKAKGSCPGLVDLVKLFAEWDARCDEQIEPLCGVFRLFFTYDGESYLRKTESTLSANNGIVSVAGQTTLYTARIFEADGVTAGDLPLEMPLLSFVIDAMGTFACVDTVAAPGGGQQVITFDDATAKLRREITGSGTFSGTGNVFTITSIDTTSYPWQFPSPAAAPVFGDGAWVGYSLMDSAGTIRTVVTSAATSGGTTVLTLSGAVVTGVFSLAKAFDPAGATYAGRIPLLSATLYVGEFSLTYDSTWDIRLLSDRAVGPWSLLTSVHSTVGAFFAPTPADVVMWVANQHELIGTATGTRLQTLSDSTQAWADNEWSGYYLLPNWNQTKIFRIVGNTATDLVVLLPEGGGISAVAIEGATYVILSEKNARRYARLVPIMASFIPLEAKPYLKFETT